MKQSKKYQVRIRKILENSEIHHIAETCFGACIVAEIRTLEGTFLDMKDAFEKMATVKKLNDYEIISVILIDEDNREQLGEEFDWEEHA
ncbi:hypothetical protein I0P11_07480 [Acinetobacter baumannii]|uniref:hypothetical protein n=1 Tax=Acinetobacter baumannii TaxID=470 RepID=UPI0018AFCF1F|nr:hypothetical protein [Acinetobacter baumannii]MBF9260979.1 hypothetical protein [Acinetobacter baumannii]